MALESFMYSLILTMSRAFSIHSCRHLQLRKYGSAMVYKFKQASINPSPEWRKAPYSIAVSHMLTHIPRKALQIFRPDELKEPCQRMRRVYLCGALLLS